MLDFAVVEITNQCNLKCKHCYDVFTGGRQLSEEDQTMIIENLVAEKCKRVTISGGEPLVVGENVFKFAQKIKDKGMKVVMVTNGTLVKKFPLSYYKVFDHIQISLDGPKEVHEQIRGKGTFDKTIEAMEFLKQAEVGLSFQITINSFNQYLFDETLDIATKLGVGFSVERVSHTGRAKDIEEIDYDNYKQILLKVVNNKLLTSDPLLNGVICEKFRIEPNNDVVRGCSAGRGGICISSNLDIYPCVRLRKKCGNLQEQTLTSILENSIYSELGNREKLTGKCGQCKYKYICGGCRADAWLANGEYFSEDKGCVI